MPNRSKFSLDIKNYYDIDARLSPFLKDWKVVQNYKNKTVKIPGTWNSEIFPVKYFEVIKTPDDPNYDPSESENEIGLTLWAGWKESDNSGAYDHEVEFNIFIMGKDVNNQKNYKVSSEILKAGGAYMQVFFNNQLITDFSEEYWFGKKKVDKVWVDDMNKFLNTKNDFKT